MFGVPIMKSFNDEKTKDAYIKYLLEELDVIGIDKNIRHYIIEEYKKYTIDELRHEMYSRPSSQSRLCLESINRCTSIKESLNHIEPGDEELVLNTDLMVPVIRRLLIRYVREHLKLDYSYREELLVIHNIKLCSVDLDNLEKSLVYNI